MGLLFWLVLAAAVAFVGYLLFDAILGWTRQRRFYRRRHRHRD
jgi:membrane protein required for beta-lactamase induction